MASGVLECRERVAVEFDSRVPASTTMRAPSTPP